MPAKLTARQQQCLDFIASHSRDKGYPPTLREIGEHMGIRSTNGVSDHLAALERKGYIERQDLKSRSVRVVGSMPPQLPELPPGYEVVRFDDFDEPRFNGWHIMINGEHYERCDHEPAPQERADTVEEAWAMWLSSVPAEWREFIDRLRS